MVDAATNPAKRAAKSKDYQSLHELHESAMHGSTARLGSRKTNRTFEKGKHTHTQLSFLNQDRTDGSPKERISSDYGDDLLDEDFPSLDGLLNPHGAQKQSFQVTENDSGPNDDTDSAPRLSPTQMDRYHVAPGSRSSKTVVDDGRNKPASSTLKAGREFFTKSIGKRQRSPRFTSDDEIEDDEASSVPSNSQPTAQDEFPPNSNTGEIATPRPNRHPNDDRLFVMSSPKLQPDNLHAQSPAGEVFPRRSKRQRTSSSHEQRSEKRPKCTPDKEMRRAPLAENPPSQNSQPEIDQGLKQAKHFGHERVAPSQAQSLKDQNTSAQSNSAENDILSRIPKSWGDISGIDLSLLAEFADFVDFE